MYLVFLNHPQSRECWKYWDPYHRQISKLWGPISRSCGNLTTLSRDWAQHCPNQNLWMASNVVNCVFVGGVLGLGPILGVPGDKRCILTPHFLWNSSWIRTKLPPISRDNFSPRDTELKMALFPKNSTSTVLPQIWRVGRAGSQNNVFKNT
jgi:hypothetical protein